ncbi:hypothetical protein DL96DRAFT_1715224 [Flagelloscypha sp. PMI_526]|nr:hypothetical protein DL96DRAFT_1715224 [Flagelloscypha sp. PMI_526]
MSANCHSQYMHDFSTSPTNNSDDQRPSLGASLREDTSLSSQTNEPCSFDTAHTEALKILESNGHQLTIMNLDEVSQYSEYARHLEYSSNVHHCAILLSDLHTISVSNTAKDLGVLLSHLCNLVTLRLELPFCLVNDGWILRSLVLSIKSPYLEVVESQKSLFCHHFIPLLRKHGSLKKIVIGCCSGRCSELRTVKTQARIKTIGAPESCLAALLPTISASHIIVSPYGRADPEKRSTVRCIPAFSRSKANIYRINLIFNGSDALVLYETAHNFPKLRSLFLCQTSTKSKKLPWSNVPLWWCGLAALKHLTFFALRTSVDLLDPSTYEMGQDFVLLDEEALVSAWFSQHDIHEVRLCYGPRNTVTIWYQYQGVWTHSGVRVDYPGASAINERAIRRALGLLRDCLFSKASVMISNLIQYDLVVI